MASCSPVNPLHATTCRAYLLFVLSMPIRLRQSLARDLRDVAEYNLERKRYVFNVFGWLAEAAGGWYLSLRRVMAGPVLAMHVFGQI